MPALYLVTFGGLGIRKDGSPAEGAGAQRRRLALLALLAAAGERGLSREKLLSLLWPESDLERARKNLAQAVYALRRDLGAEDLVLGTTDLRLNPDYIGSDLADFRRFLTEGRPAEAVALYRGPFLDGIYLDEAPEFERWAETERTALAHDYIHALEKLAAGTTEPRAAVGYWRLLANADPLNAKSALGLMRALAAAGDRAAALQHYRVYEMLLRQELDLAPDAAVKRLADDLREPGSGKGEASIPPVPGDVAAPPVPRSVGPTVPITTVPGTPAVARPVPVPEPSARKHISGYTDEYARPRPVERRNEGTAERRNEGTAERRNEGPFVRRHLRGLVIAGIALALVAVGVLRVRLVRDDFGAGAGTPVIAVGMIKDYTRSGDGMARPLGDMLATDLARNRSMQVISTARMYELIAQGEAMADSSASAVRAARAAGATELLDGALYRRPDGRLRLDLSRTSLATGSVIETYSAEGGDLFGLVDEVRRVITRGLDSTAAGSIGDVTTRSLVAYKFYEEGLRAIFRGENRIGAELMRQALDQDTTFAMAAYWLATTQGSFNDAALIRGLEHAVKLSARATDRERLIIKSGWASATDHPSRMAVAETLTVRYPNEPDGFNWLAGARISSGDFLGAIAPLRRVVKLDTASLRIEPRADGPPVRCHACVAYLQLINVYGLLDSLPAALRTAEEWTRASPQHPGPFGQVSWVLMLLGRYREAEVADQAVISRDPSLTREHFRVHLALRTGAFAVADSYYTRLANGSLPSEGAKWLSTSLRMQGRPRAALDWARKLRAMQTAPRGAAPYAALFEAQCWYELGEFRRAAAVFDSISRSPLDTTLSQRARNLTWTQLLRSTALAAAGDTALLPAIADSLEGWGRLNSYGRDGRAHHHARGLLAAARGDLAAAEREFRAAIYSPTGGYTRTNIELAKVLMRLNRPREAAYWVDAARRGGMDASPTYATHSELLELGALAWDAAGERDSAVTRYTQLLHNWRDAEPVYQARVERARLRLEQLRR